MKILIDTSILIDFYRKENKEKSKFYQLVEKNHTFAISVITEYEILVGSNGLQDEYWREFFGEVEIIPLSSEIIQEAVIAYREMKQSNQLIEIPDILIGSTAKHHKLPIATLNKKHFGRIEGLKIH